MKTITYESEFRHTGNKFEISDASFMAIIFDNL